MEDHWKCQNCGNSVPDGLIVCPKCGFGLVKGGFDELPGLTADGLEKVEQKVKVEIPFILYLGAVCSIILAVYYIFLPLVTQ